VVRRSRTHLPGDNQTPSSLVPKHLTKQEFGKRLYGLMLARGWNQSELGRQSGLPRDSISTYVRGQSLPTPQNLKALSEAFGIEAEELLPNQVESAIDEDNPSFEMKTSTSAPNMAWVRVNRLVTMQTAIRIADLLENDRVLDRSGSGSATEV
jgi:transcriptional regulator with XRE-family HTH domain